MSGIAILDTHVHLTDRARWKDTAAYSWHGSNACLDNDFTPAVFASEAMGDNDLGVKETLFMECLGCPDWQLKEEEAKWACKLAEEGVIGMRGVIAGCPVGSLPAADVENFLAKISHPMLKGVRNLQQVEADGFGSTKDYIEGCRVVAKHGLTVDLCLKGAAQLADAIVLVKAAPEVQFMLDHIGKPNIKANPEAEFDGVWAKGLTELASLPNVWCKISGVVTEVEESRWSPEAIAPYVKHAIDAFGWDRVVYGGDWYASKLAISEYKEWLQALQSLPVIMEATWENRVKLFKTNAETFYKL